MWEKPSIITDTGCNNRRRGRPRLLQPVSVMMLGFSHIGNSMVEICLLFYWQRSCLAVTASDTCVMTPRTASLSCCPSWSSTRTFITSASATSNSDCATSSELLKNSANSSSRRRPATAKTWWRTLLIVCANRWLPSSTNTGTWRRGVVVTSSVSINEVNLRWARLVLEWVAVSGIDSWRRHFISMCNQPPRSTQPSNLRETVKWVPAKGRWCSAAVE